MSGARRLNIVVVFDAIVRHETTGRYVVRALRELGHNVSHYMPMYRKDNAMVFKHYTDVLFDEADFLLYVDDDINYPIYSGSEIPKYYWCIDTHRMNTLVGGSTRWERIKAFDKVFMAQRDRAEETGSIWLPLAYDPAVWHVTDEAKAFDWSFIGNFDPKREAFFGRIREAFPNGYGGKAYFAEANSIYNRSWLSLNLTFSNDINMRFFEAQATSSLLLSNPVHNGEDTLFSALELFNDVEHCIERMGELLSDKQELRRRAQRQTDDIANHTYLARMRSLLETLGYPQQEAK